MKLNIQQKTLESDCIFFGSQHATSSAHTMSHTKRVLRNALKIMTDKKLNLNIDAIIVSAILHDVSRSKGFHGEIHGAESFKMIRGFLYEIGLDSSTIKLICQCICNHCIDDKRIHKSNEEKVIYDADKMDGFGLRGYCRIISYHFFERKRSTKYVWKKMTVGMKLRRQNLHFENY